MKKLIFLLVAVMIITANLYSQWVLQSTSTTSHLNSIVSVSATTLYASGENEVVLKTTNGGTNWITLRENPAGKDYYGLWFIDANTGFAVGGLDSPLKVGVISKTTNGGVNWVDNVYNNICFRTAYFLNANTGFLGGWTNWVTASPIYMTTNGGYNWDSIPSFNSYGIEDIFFLNANTGWATGDMTTGEAVFKTTNGGYNWAMASNQGYGLWLSSVKFVNANTGWITGAQGSPQGGLLRKTTDGGATFTAQVHHNTNELYKPYFINENTGWVVGDNPNIQKTTNGGINWNVQSTPGAWWMWDVKFIDANTGWACGSQGKIFYTTNGGGPVSVQNISTEIPSAYSLKQNYPNPFNPTTKIRFSLPVSSPHALGGDLVQLKVFDVLGHEVQTLVNEVLQPGTYETSFVGSTLNSGVYFYKITAGDFSETKRMLLIK